MMNQKLILRTYNDTKSIKKTAEKAKMSEQAVRKLLISRGLYTNARIEQIKGLAALGFSQKQIAEHLNISTSAVCSNFPYSRGTYLTNTKSRNALAIKKCRQRKRENHE